MSEDEARHLFCRQVIAEYDGSDTLLRKFIYGPGLDEPICMITYDDEGTETGRYWYHFDALGSVIALSQYNNSLTYAEIKEQYNIPSIWTSEAFFFKRTHHVPKLVKNSANVYVTDSAYRIRTNEDVCVNSLIYSFYNSLTLTFCELYGRFYGGGVLELTPNEFMNLPLPYLKITQNDFDSFVNAMNENTDSVESCISDNDKAILKEKYELDDDLIKAIQAIRNKLQKRRMKN